MTAGREADSKGAALSTMKLAFYHHHLDGILLGLTLQSCKVLPALAPDQQYPGRLRHKPRTPALPLLAGFS